VFSGHVGVYRKSDAQSQIRAKFNGNRYLVATLNTRLCRSYVIGHTNHVIGVIIGQGVSVCKANPSRDAMRSERKHKLRKLVRMRPGKQATVELHKR
jgi:hypothetical protein